MDNCTCTSREIVSIVYGNDFTIEAHVSVYDKDGGIYKLLDLTGVKKCQMRLVGTYRKAIGKDVAVSGSKVTAFFPGGSVGVGTYGVEITFVDSLGKGRIFERNLIGIVSASGEATVDNDIEGEAGEGLDVSVNVLTRTVRIGDVGSVLTDYNLLENRPSIGGVTLEGNKRPSDLGIYSKEEADGKFQTKESAAEADKRVQEKLDGKVDKEPGKGLSANDLTDERAGKVDKLKIDGRANEYLNGAGIYSRPVRQGYGVSLSEDNTVSVDPQVIARQSDVANVAADLAAQKAKEQGDIDRANAAISKEETDRKAAVAALQSLIDILNPGYQFMGVATPDTNPGTLDQKVFYVANGKGTYTNFGEISITEDEVVILYYDTAWHKLLTGIASQAKLSELDLRVGYGKRELSYNNAYLKSIDVNNWFAGILATINTNQKSVIVPLDSEGTIELIGNPDNASYYCLLSAIPSSLANGAVVDTYSDGFTKALSVSPGSVTKISYTEESKILLLFYSATDATYCRLPSMVSISTGTSGLNKEIESIKQDYEAKPRYFDGDYREEAEAFIEEINIFSDFTMDDELVISSYGTHKSGKLFISFTRKSNITSTVAIASASSLNKGERVLMPIRKGATIAYSIKNNPIGYVIVRRAEFPNTALTSRNLSILDACFNGNSKSIMSNCQFLLNAGYSPIIDLLKNFYVDKTISKECDSTAFSIRPVLSIPNYDDRIIIASNIEDYKLRDGSESDEVLVKAFAPYVYFKMKKIGTFVLFDEDGRAFYYDKVGNKKYIVTE